VALVSVVSQRNAINQPLGGSNRSFGFVFAGVFALVGLAPVLVGNTARAGALVGAALFLLVALLAPSLLGPLNRLWTRLGIALHRFTSSVALWILLYVVLAPIGLLLRVSGKDILRLRQDPHAESYWIRRDPPGPAAETMRNQF
jgi:hypothetical protein